MVIKSIHYPTYHRPKKGLTGKVYKLSNIPKSRFERTFEDYLMEVFQGEVVQEGGFFASSLSDLTIRNLRKL